MNRILKIYYTPNIIIDEIIVWNSLIIIMRKNIILELDMVICHNE